MDRLMIAALVMFTGQLPAQGYQAEIDRFFQLYGQGKKVAAVDSIYSSNPWMGSASDAIQNIKTQLQNIEKLVGGYNGSEFIHQVSVKDRFVHVTYMALYDRQPMRMEFQFYRPKSDWMIYSFSFDMDFDDELEAGARASIVAGK